MIAAVPCRVAETRPSWGTTDPHVVRAARGGCDRSFVELYESLEKRVRRTASCILRDEHDAEDTVQETFLAVYEGLPRLSDPAAFEGWVMRIARFKAISATRRRARCGVSSRVHSDTDDLGGHDGAIVSRTGAEEPAPEALLALREALSSLRPEVLETLTLKYSGARSCEEIARLQGVSVGCVKTRLFRGRKRVREAVLGRRP